MDASVEKLLDRYRQHNLSQVVDYDKFSHYAITHHSNEISKYEAMLDDRSSSGSTFSLLF